MTDHVITTHARYHLRPSAVIPAAMLLGVAFWYAVWRVMWVF